MKSVSVIEAKFLRSKLSTAHTKPWKETDSLIQNRIIESIVPLREELFVLCFFPNENYWWVITNMRLIISECNSIQYLPLESIEKIEISGILNGSETKQAAQTIYLESQHRKVNLITEKGTWHVIYDILKFIT